MFTYGDFKSLAEITDRDKQMSAVAQIPEEDLRAALFITLLSLGKNMELTFPMPKGRGFLLPVTVP